MEAVELFYVAKPPRVLDAAIRREDGVLMGRFSGETAEELAAKYSAKIECGSFAAWRKAHYEGWRTDPVETTLDQWEYALNVLPPEDWHTVDGVESFKMCEYQSSDMTVIYARKGDRYWSFCDMAILPAAVIAERINAIAEGGLTTVPCS